MDKNYNELLLLLSGKTMSDENFPVASFLISKKKRKHIKNLYFFARASDDIADNKQIDSNNKKKILREFDKMLNDRRIKSYGFINDLNESLIETKVSKIYPRKLLQAFLQDVKKNRYSNWVELINYCDHSASPIGRFVVDLYDKEDAVTQEKIYEGCDDLCNALQILNHIQDCKDDFLELNRIYIPEDYFYLEKIKPEEFMHVENRKKFLNVKNKCLLGVEKLLKSTKEKIILIKNPSLKKETYVIYNIAKKLTKILMTNDPIKKKLKLSRIDLIFCFFKGIIGRL